MGAGKVALVHDWLTGMRGGEKVLEVLCRLLPDAPIHTLVHVPGSVSDAIQRHPIHTSCLQHLPRIKDYYRHCLPIMPLAQATSALTLHELKIAGLCLPFTILAMVLGTRVHYKLNEVIFRRIVYAVLVIAAVSLLASVAKG